MAHKREEEAELKVPETHLTCTSSLSLSSSSAIEYPDPPIPSRSDPPTPFSNSQKTADRTAFSSFPLPNRCAGCRRKVGLTGFRCRCGDLFCTEHRYSDRHDCSFDYKAAGREAIARDNPVVRPAKLLKV